MDLLFAPQLWGLFSTFSLFLLVAQESIYQTKKSFILKAILALLFVAFSVFMMIPLNDQPRFNSDVWHLYVGGALIVFSVSIIILAFLKIIELFQEKAQFSTSGIYSLMRNPLHLGIIIFITGCAVFFKSIYGLLYLFLWIPGLFIHVIVQEQNFENYVGLPYIKYKRQINHRFFPVISTPKQQNIRQFPYKNLVFKGGGVKGIAYKGVIEVLTEYKILDQVNRVAGTSAGAITAMILSLRLDLEDTIKIIDSLDFSKIPEKDPLVESQVYWAPDFLKKEIGEISGNIECLRRFTRKFGWYSSEYFYNWLKDTIARYCNGNGMATFQDFKDKNFRELYVVATNISKYTGEVFSYKNTPNTSVADAVRMSMSIPLFFEALRYNGEHFGEGDYYADGGIFYNYPTYIFDSIEFSKNNHWFNGGINWETLGFYLYPLEDSLSREKTVGDIGDYIERVLDNIAQASDITALEALSIDYRRMVKISDCNVAPTDFFIDIHHPKYAELVESGKNATKNFLDNFLAPVNIHY